MELNKLTLKDYIFVLLKGILLGLISFGIPGFSASTIGIIIGIYFYIVEAIANLFKSFKRNALFLIFLMIGYAIGVMAAAFSLTTLLEKYHLASSCAIIGIIIGAIINMIGDIRKVNYKKISCWITFFAVFALLAVYNLIVAQGTQMEFPRSPAVKDLVGIAIIGLLTSATFIVPGVDFAVMFLSLGIYYPFMNMLTELVSFGAENYVQTLLVDLQILGAYLIGYFVGIFLFSKLIKILSDKFNDQTQFASLAFVVAAPPVFLKSCVFENPNFRMTTPQWIVGVILGIIGFLLMIWFDRYGKHKAMKKLAQTASNEGETPSPLIAEDKDEENADENDKNSAISQ